MIVKGIEMPVGCDGACFKSVIGCFPLLFKVLNHLVIFKKNNVTILLLKYTLQAMTAAHDTQRYRDAHWVRWCVRMLSIAIHCRFLIHFKI